MRVIVVVDFTDNPSTGLRFVSADRDWSVQSYTLDRPIEKRFSHHRSGTSAQWRPRARLGLRYASKAAEQAVRIAGVLALWADQQAHAVTARDMAHGIELAQFYLSEAVRLADAAMVSQEIDLAETLRKWLRESWAGFKVMVRDVERCGPNPLCESPKARKALNTLEAQGWIVKLKPERDCARRSAGRGMAYHQGWAR